MTLVVHELTSSPIEQRMTPQKNTIVHAIRPHLYRHNFATGSLKLQIYDNLDVLVSESEVINISAIGTQAFFHGYIRFLVSAYLKKDIEYKIKLVSGDGYSFSEPAYIGWCTDFDLAKYPRDQVPENYLSYPLALEIWEKTTK